MSFLKIFILFSFSLCILFSCSGDKETLLIGKWKAKQIVNDDGDLNDDQISLTYLFTENGRFERIEDGRTEEGEWKLSDDKSRILFTYDENKITREKTIKELSDHTLILEGKVGKSNTKETLERKTHDTE